MPQDPILCSNQESTVYLIDIPASIADGQDASRAILSSSARETPFPSAEPKSQKAREKVLARVKTPDHEGQYVEAINDALAVIRENHSGEWALPRFVHVEGPMEQMQLHKRETQISKTFESLMKSDGQHSITQFKEQASDQRQIVHEWDGSYYNENDSTIKLHVQPTDNALESSGSQDTPKEEPLVFHIPPHASFLLSDCNSPNKFRNHVRWLAQEHGKSRKFDFTLLDPPWENRSAKRRAAYETSSVRTMISEMDLGTYLQPCGLVGIWVTNKAAHRELVLGSGGLFEGMNVTLIEEWIWIKTTSRGEPVTQIDGIWRKPYEVLLLGQAQESRLQVAKPAGHVIRRILAGVPDFHSRKPCLKALIDARLPEGYQALEVFARYLVRGWTSWGNEVLKYNWEGYHANGEKYPDAQGLSKGTIAGNTLAIVDG